MSSRANGNRVTTAFRCLRRPEFPGLPGQGPGNDRCSGKDLGADGTVDPSGEMILGVGATKRSGDLAILEQDQGRDGAHVIGARCTWVLVDVELLDTHLA